MHFITATLSHIPVIHALANEIWYTHYPGIITTAQIDYMLRTRYSPAAIAEGMKRGERFYLAIEGEMPVAYAAFERGAHSYFLHKFYVLTRLHRQGTGTRFWQFLEAEMNEPLPIRLQVNRQNYKAINFYFRHGFTIEQVADFDIGNGFFMNDFVMVKSRP